MKEENDVIINPKEKNKKKMSNLLGVLFLIWFLGSIIGMIYFSAKEQSHYVVMIFGQYFLVFGMIAFFNCKGKERLSSMPFIVSGLACIIIPFLMLHPELFDVSINWDAIIPLLAILVFVIAGLALIILPILHKRKSERICTKIVNATIIDYLHEKNDRTDVYCPVYTFKFNNKEYKVSSNFYTNFDLKPVGSIVELKINPNDPEEIWENATNLSFSIILGILFLVVSVPILLFMLMTFSLTQ